MHDPGRFSLASCQFRVWATPVMPAGSLRGRPSRRSARRRDTRRGAEGESPPRAKKDRSTARMGKPRTSDRIAARRRAVAVPGVRPPGSPELRSCKAVRSSLPLTATTMGTASERPVFQKYRSLQNRVNTEPNCPANHGRHTEYSSNLAGRVGPPAGPRRHGRASARRAAPSAPEDGCPCDSL